MCSESKLGDNMKKSLFSLTPIAIALLSITACSPANETSQTQPTAVKSEKDSAQTESQRLTEWLRPLSPSG